VQCLLYQSRIEAASPEGATRAPAVRQARGAPIALAAAAKRQSFQWMGMEATFAQLLPIDPTNAVEGYA
jgi:hypothetical protein